MVLRLFILIILVLNSSAFARSKKHGRTIYLKTAQNLFKHKKYKKSIKTLDRIYQINNPRKLPTAIIQLLALNFFKIKRYNASSKYFHIVISRKYRKVHQRVLYALDNDSLDQIEAPKQLLRIYYRLGQIYYYNYSKTKNTAYFRASEKFFKICEEKEHLDDNATEYLDSLAAKKAFVAKKEFIWKWFASAGTVNWQEKLILQNSTTGKETKLLSNARALCVGGGFRYGNAYHGFEVHGCGFSGSAKISASNPNIYAQDGVAVTGLLLDSGYTIKSPYEKASFTMSLPLFYRDGDYAQPTNYQILGKGQLSAGVLIKGRLELPIIDFVVSMGNLGWTNILTLEAAYTF